MTVSRLQANQTGWERCVYEDQHFADRVMTAIAPSPAPFFVFWAPRVVHSPLEVPEQQLDRFSFIDDGARRYLLPIVPPTVPSTVPASRLSA